METWNHCHQENNTLPTIFIANNISRIKDKTNKWAKDKGIKDEEELRRVERDISLMNDVDGLGHSSLEDKENLTQLEMEIIKLLRKKEET